MVMALEAMMDVISFDARLAHSCWVGGMVVKNVN